MDINIEIFEEKQRITQNFGENFYRNGKLFYQQFGLKGHNGVDFGTPIGTKIKNVIPGIVATGSGNVGYGNWIKITNYDMGIEILYAHLNKIYIKNGDIIGDIRVIGETGNTGNSTGPHLHFSVRKIDKDGKVIDKDNGFGGYLDPILFFKDINMENTPGIYDKLSGLNLFDENEDDKKIMMNAYDTKKLIEIAFLRYEKIKNIKT